jgi:hypothetical protein
MPVEELGVDAKLCPNRREPLRFGVALEEQNDKVAFVRQDLISRVIELIQGCEGHLGDALP